MCVTHVSLRSGEAALPFEFQFELHACQLSAKLLNLLSKLGVANSLSVQSPDQILSCLARMIRLNHQRPQRRTTEMRTAPDG